MTVVERFNSHWIPEPYSGCWIWMIAIDKDGYGLFKSLKGVMRRAHRFSWEIYRGTIPPGNMVLHRCDVPSCVNPDHLYLGNGFDNMQDRSRRGGLNQNGERNPVAKLTWLKVEIIRASTESNRVLGRRFGVAPTTISNIKCGKIWTKR